MTTLHSSTARFLGNYSYEQICPGYFFFVTAVNLMIVWNAHLPEPFRVTSPAQTNEARHLKNLHFLFVSVPFPLPYGEFSNSLCMYTALFLKEEWISEETST